MWKAKQASYDASKWNIPCRDNNDKYYGIQHELKKYNMDQRKTLNPMLICQPHICGPRMIQNHSQSKHGLMWVHSH